MKRCLGCMELYGDDFDICPSCGFIDGTIAEERIHMDPGTIIDNRYIVGRVLGYGGFGVTYIGWDGKLEQKVAIKEYLPSEFSTRMPGQSRVTVFTGDKKEQYSEGLTKFVEESKRLAKFQNEPGIVKIFDSFEENDTAYIIMEYLDGETLTQKISRNGKIPEDEAVEMMMAVMNSLNVVHEAGILHRDIAPDNIFITKSGDIKLIDFGASRYATTSHSRSLTVIIKPGYSPEEQYRSRGDQGPYTDVYALGACLYKMITGKTPPDAMERRAFFESKNKDILVPPHNLVKNISSVRENAILNAMNVRIEDRTPTVQALIDELNSDVPIKRKNGRIKKIDLYRWPLWFKIVAASVVCGILTIGGLMGTGVIRFDSLFSDEIVVPEGMVIVPNIEGKDISKALDIADSKSLICSISGSVVSNYVEAGKIVQQTPASGLYVEENSALYLYVSKGTGETIKPVENNAIVPYLVGSTEEEALNDLVEAGLGTSKLVYEYDENMAEGLVISQDKQFGEKVTVGTQISLVVSKGPKPFEMPNMCNKSSNLIKEELQNKGILVEYTYTETPDYPDGYILSQGTPAGTLIRKLDTVNLEIAKAVWSEWSTTAPDPSKTIESKTQYSYARKETTTQTDNNRLDGWNLEESLTRVEEGEYGDWSTPSLTPVSETATRKVQTIPAYRFRNKEYATSNSTSLAGYTIVSNTPSSYSEWSNWSDWSTDSQGTNDLKEERKEQRYRYQKKLYTSSTNSNLGDGWNLIGSPSYGEWSENKTTTTKPEENDTCQIVNTTYRYYHWMCYGGYVPSSNGWSVYTDNVSGAGHYHAIELSEPLTSIGNVGYGDFYNGPGCGGDSSSRCGFSAYWLESVTYTYQTREVSYNYWKYDNWSQWSTSNDAPNDANVDEKTFYSYRTRTPIYQFWKWSEWSDWSDKAVTATNDIDVDNTGVLYSYADREINMIYTFSRWSDYSPYSDEKIPESDTVSVKTITLYRYKTE